MHSVRPVPQVVHAPPVHTPPSPHVFKHLPQLSGSVIASVHAPLQGI